MASRSPRRAGPGRRRDTRREASAPETVLAGPAFGATLAIMHFAFNSVSGNSVNRGRSLTPALFVGGNALGQAWLYIVAPLIGGAAAALARRINLFYREE